MVSSLIPKHLIIRYGSPSTAEHGFELPDEEWGKIVGGWGVSTFDAATHLSLLSQGQLDSVSCAIATAQRITR